MKYILRKERFGWQRYVVITPGLERGVNPIAVKDYDPGYWKATRLDSLELAKQWAAKLTDRRGKIVILEVEN
jgi:hypothetical protein